MKDFCKEHYFYEVERRRDLAGRVSLPVGIITIIGTILATSFKAIDFPYSDLEKLFIFVSFLAFVSLTTAVIYLCRSYVGFTYGYIATPVKLLEYEAQLKEYYFNKGEVVSEAQIDSEVEDYITSQYAQLTDYNVQKNDKKSYFLHRANIAIIASLILTFVASLPFIYSYVTFN